MAEVGTHHGRNKRYRKRRQTRQSQGNAGESDTFGGVAIQTLGNFLGHFGGIQDGAIKIHRTPQAPMNQRTVAFILRNVTFIHYDANGVAKESTFLQGPTPQLHAMAQKLRGFAREKNVDG